MGPTDPVTTSAAVPALDTRTHPVAIAVFFLLLVGGTLFAAWSLYTDMTSLGGGNPLGTAAIVMLCVALLIAFGFEFVNGFHDTANAVATVIYTHSMPPNVAVVWSGIFNFLGVLFASGAVAFGIIALLPVELILQIGSKAGFAMVFALLLAAILWNLGTWWLGLPSSSSHTLIGSIIGVGVANAMMHGLSGTSGVAWDQVSKVGASLFISPLVGFWCAAMLLLTLKYFVKNPALYEAPKNGEPPPWWIRFILIFTCTGVSFAHGSNDGQKGMGLIMLILVGIMPATYALNQNIGAHQVAAFVESSELTRAQLARISSAPVPADVRGTLVNFIHDRKVQPEVAPALGQLVTHISGTLKEAGSIREVNSENKGALRSDMYLAAETIRFLEKSPEANLDQTTVEQLETYRQELNKATRYIPLWVKVGVAMALGLGTMVGWKRIVVTVGERIGKTHLSYAQGASAELMAMSTIMAADVFGMPVSTTHVLSSGVAGTMAANRSGLNMGTVRNLLMAWLLTLPASIALSGGLYWLFLKIF